MSKKRLVIFCMFAGMLTGLFPSLLSEMRGSSVPANEQAIWDLEHSYWRYVQENNLSAYLSLWHKDFLGWPFVNEAPVRKDHITDWITSRTTKGLAFRLVALKLAGIQISGDLAVVCYWVKTQWADKAGASTDVNLRVMHTWVKAADGWQIVGGMSMPEAVKEQK